ncbi:thiamine ABC transporter substrate binding subunit [Rhizobium sp. KVB221]|uniref:Thiamine ABC transporter substrate binding subunit n=1 Tax=Rhizobium setariae TaxID=2801340 RepID=A0A936YR29_9HYPH|nr:thiamine ABC transporter substrate binding subunit [Rhizobium setariae]MBL0374118.1 thiamine ABC transporter substrate binding subunit [Rhizobium setariae]
MRRISLFAAAAFAVFSLPALAAQKSLTIYTYESFTSEWGPGPKVKAAFEKSCDCTVNYVSLGDGVALLTRLKMEGAASKADIVLGIDNNLTEEAKATGLFVDHGIDTSAVKVPGGFEDPVFVPYDYGHFAVIINTNEVKNPPKSLHDLVDGDPAEKIVIEDPRTSTPGLGMLFWVKSVYGDKAPEAWAKLSKRILTVTPGWSEAYGLFTKGEAPMVLSYTTSPAYHMIAENVNRYQAVEFSEGHPIQIEVAGITKAAKDKELAQAFLKFMIGPDFQDIIPENNWMMPVAATSKPLNPVFDKLVHPAKTLTIPAAEAAAKRKAWVDEWLAAMSMK